MALKVKICGLNTPDVVDAAVSAGADMIGFVFHPKSPRHVSLDFAAELAERARGKAEIVALTVDAPLADLERISAALRPDWLQLHGREPVAFVRSLAQRRDLPQVIKAVGVATPDDLAQVRAYGGSAPLILLDAKPPKDAAYPGGHGKTFDWTILEPTKSHIMLSGGLHADNVAEAVGTARKLGLWLAAVDVSSGVETAPGVKDADKIFRFVAAARAADAATPGGLSAEAIAAIRTMWRPDR